MKICQKIFLGLALFVTLQSTLASSIHRPNCGFGSGTDVCGCTSFAVKAAKPSRPGRFVDAHMIQEATAIRQTPKHYGCGSLHSTQHKTNGPTITDLLSPSCGPVAPRFRPIGDLCTGCKASVAEVIPAYPGKPVCNLCAQKALMSESAISDPGYSRSTFTSSSAGNTELNTFEDDCLSFDEQENIYNSGGTVSVPADPVSLSLAFGLAHQTHRSVPEAGLAFGPKSIAIDGSVRKTAINIPEEKLFTIEKPLVELKLSAQRVASDRYADLIAEQEALEQKRLELEAQAETSSGTGIISYSELGYGPVTSTGNNFVSTVSHDSQVETEDEVPCGPLGPAIPGYQSGNVIVRTESPQQNEDDDQYDEGSFEDADFSASSSSEDAESSYGGSGFLARLKASAHAQNHRKGCGCGCGN